MSEWLEKPIRALLSDSFAGEWGGPPNRQPAHVLRATDIDDDGHIRSDGAARSIPQGVLNAKRLIDGDLILEASGGSTDRPVGRVAYFDRGADRTHYLSSNFFKTLRPAGGVAPRYLFWKLHWFHKQPTILSLQQQTTGIINLKFQDYLDTHLNVPEERAEQSAIARILDTLDTQIEKTQALIAKLEQVKEGLLHDLLTRGVDENGELRPSAEEAPELYKASALGLIPREWEASTVEKAFSVASGITLGAHRVPLRHPRKYLRVANVQRNRISLDDVLTLEATDAEVANLGLRVGDLLIVEGHASSYEIGRCAMVNRAAAGMLFQNHLFRLRPYYLNPTFGLLWMNSTHVRNYWRREAATSSGLNTINRAKLSKVLVATPSQHEQGRIIQKVGTIDARIATETAGLRKCVRKKAGLMDDLLTGRVRVTPLLDS